MTTLAHTAISWLEDRGVARRERNGVVSYDALAGGDLRLTADMDTCRPDRPAGFRFWLLEAPFDAAAQQRVMARMLVLNHSLMQSARMAMTLSPDGEYVVLEPLEPGAAMTAASPARHMMGLVRTANRLRRDLREAAAEPVQPDPRWAQAL